MPEEVEVKLRVDDLDAVRASLMRLGEPLKVGVLEVDTYYGHPCRDFRSTDEALRIRLAGAAAELTYKGPRAEGDIKRRIELTARVDGQGTISAVLESLGFTKVAVVTKVRSYYKVAGAIVALDHVEGLGDFVEVEAVDRHTGADELRGIAEELGLSWVPLRESYLEMLLEGREGEEGA